MARMCFHALLRFVKRGDTLQTHERTETTTNATGRPPPPTHAPSPDRRSEDTRHPNATDAREPRSQSRLQVGVTLAVLVAGLFAIVVHVVSVLVLHVVLAHQQRL